MSDAGICLGDLISLKGADIESVLQEHIKESSAVAGAAGPILGFLASEAAEKLSGAMNADVFELIAHAWTKVRALEEYSDPKKHPPGETEIQTLGEHEITKTDEPVLTIEYGRVKLPALRFALELTVRFRSVALSISDGAIHSVAPGQVTALTCLKYKQEKLKELESEPLKLPGRIKFDKPIPIAKGNGPRSRQPDVLPENL
jgi:hypothetical protein